MTTAPVVLARYLRPGDRVRSVGARDPVAYEIATHPHTDSGGITRVRGCINGGEECDLIFVASAELERV